MIQRLLAAMTTTFGEVGNEQLGVPTQRLP